MITGLSVSAARGHDRLHLLEVVDVERRQAVAVFGGVVEQLAHRDEGHGGLRGRDVRGPVDFTPAPCSGPGTGTAGSGAAQVAVAAGAEHLVAVLAATSASLNSSTSCMPR